MLSFVNTFVFGLFAIFATTRWLLRYGSCGCSGNLEIPAAVFIVLDLAIVAWFSRSTFSRGQILAGGRELIGWWRGWSWEMRGRLVGIVLFCGVLLLLQLPLAAPLRAMVLGEPPIQATVKLNGELRYDQETTGEVEIWNRSPDRAKIVGLNRSCRCFKLIDDPIMKTVPAGGRISFPLIVKPEKTGPLHQRVVLFLDHPEQFRMNVDVLGSVKGVD